LISPQEKPLILKWFTADGTTHTIIANHTYNAQQIQWFKEGSALNLIKKQNASLKSTDLTLKIKPVSKF